ncbi:hypothetical protein [Aquimarina sp. MMG016]|uniref:hypothetical protein n=1 Tax=Aquimarina sp. MMG016 TaxID=2822690 RepID=UPI001B3A1487|nr:hypothetical protein [Aquimarina sp. MMG016]MBQ4819862.1 hypothetical protein [Aquimarina sp. MMG016]
MRRTLMLLLTGILFVSLGCDKEEDILPIIQSEFYIQGKVDGELIYTDYIGPGNIDIYRISDPTYFSFERKISRENHIIWDVSVSDLNLDNAELPITIRNYGGIGEPSVQFYFSNDNGDEGINYGVDNIDPDRFDFTITSWSDDIITGAFSGELISGSNPDKFITVTDGSFRIKLTRFDFSI